MRVALSALAVLGALATLGVEAAHAWDYAAGITAAYDDNFLNYSERDLFAFRYRLNPPRYGVETTDDFVLAPYVEVSREADSVRSASLRARIVAPRYTTNTIRNHAQTELQGRVWLSPRWRASLGASYLHSYYARRYVDHDLAVPYPELPRYRDARYRQTEGAAGIEWRPGRSWRGQVGYEYGRRDYLEAFPERDQDRHALKLSVRPPRLGRVEARVRGGVGRTLARGRSRAQDGNDGNQDDGSPSVPDVSTWSFGTGLVLGWTPRPRDPSITLRQAIDYENRHYTTSDASDTQRFGRSIHETDLEWEVVVGLARHWQIAGGYDLVVQRLTGPQSGLQVFTDAGNYHRHGVSLRLGWTSRASRSD